jgi:G3E family GTPase
MCCLSGLPMQIALNQLLHEAKPHRLLIEPTGLGHPLEVIQVLSNQYYQKALKLEKTITLVDARQLADSRYTEHTIFNQQIEIADIIVGSKLDLYQQSDKEALKTYLKAQPFIAKETVFIEHGQLPLKLLSGTTLYKVKAKQHQHNYQHSHQGSPATDAVTLPKSGFIKAVNKGEGFVSVGWRFAPEKVFDKMKLHAFLADIEVTRIKAVFITSQGIYGYNTANDGAAEVTLDKCNESRIEIICTQIDETWQQALLSCIKK